MYYKHLRRNTFIVLLCCLLIAGFLATTQASLWNWITGSKDVLEVIDKTIAALETDIKEAEDQIAWLQDLKNGALKLRNKAKAKIQPQEQEQQQKAREANIAAEAHSAASQRASGLRVEIEALTEELRYILRYGSTSSARHSEILADLAMKNSALANAEDTMSDQKKKYNAARSRYKYINGQLKSKRDYISYLTWKINGFDKKIKALNKKIVDIQKKIKAEEERREKVRQENQKEEDKWKKLEEEAKQPPN